MKPRAEARPAGSRLPRARVLLLFVALFLAAGVPAAEAQRAWSVPVPLTPAGQDARRPRLAMDASGQVAATWIREQGTTRVTQSTRLDLATGLWTLPIDISDVTNENLPEADSDIAMNAAGRAAAVWVRRTGAGEGSDQPMLAFYDEVTQRWGEPVGLASVSATALYPRVAVDENGSVLVVWVGRGASTSVVQARRYDAVEEEWSEVATLSADGSNVTGEPALAIEDDGDAAAVWTREDGRVQVAMFAVDAAEWSAPVNLSAAGQTATEPRVAASRTGMGAVVVWRAAAGSSQIVMAAHWDPVEEAWSTAVPVSALSLGILEPDVAIDESGYAVAAWTSFDSRYRNLQAAHFDPETDTWSAAADRTSGVDAAQPNLSVDAEGNAVLVWTASFGSVGEVQGAFFSVETGVWSAASTIVSGLAGAVQRPRVRLGPGGDAVAVWQQAIGGYQVVQGSVYGVTFSPRLQPAIVSGSLVTLSWSPPTAGDPPSAYTLEASATPGGAPLVALPMGLRLSEVVQAPDGVYYVRIVATVSGNPEPSNEIVVVVGYGPPPTEPLNVTAEVAGSTVTLDWAPPLNAGLAPVQTYVVEAGSGPGLANLLWFPTGSALPGYTATGVPNGTYWVRVRAQALGGLGAASPDIRVVVGPEPPGAPLLAAQVGDGGTVILDWTEPPAPGAPVTGYQLQAGSAPGLANLHVQNLPPLPRQFITIGVPPGTYYVRVVPLSPSGPGAWSNELVLTVP